MMDTMITHTTKESSVEEKMLELVIHESNTIYFTSSKHLNHVLP